MAVHKGEWQNMFVVVFFFQKNMWVCIRIFQEGDSEYSLIIFKSLGNQKKNIYKNSRGKIIKKNCSSRDFGKCKHCHCVQEILKNM